MANGSWIVPAYWDPLGESMFSIANKLSVFNQCTHREALQLIGSKGLNTLDARARQEPDNKDSLNLAAILSLTGLTPHQIAPAFTEFYFPKNLATSALPSIVVPLYERLRICKSCANDGVHLLLHQMQDCLCCPIHRTPLSCHCPECRTPTVRYWYQNFAKFPSFCDSCSFEYWKPYEFPLQTDIDARKSIIDGFKEWIKTIQNVLDGGNAKKLLLTGPARFRNLANVHALIPGPDWIEDCLFERDAIVVQTRKYSNVLNLPNERHRQQAISVFGEVDVQESYQRQACSRLSKLVLQINRKFRQTMGDTITRTPGLDTNYKNGLIYHVDGNTSPITTGYGLWQLWSAQFQPSPWLHDWADYEDVTTRYNFWQTWIGVCQDSCVCRRNADRMNRRFSVKYEKLRKRWRLWPSGVCLQGSAPNHH